MLFQLSTTESKMKELFRPSLLCFVLVNEIIHHILVPLEHLLRVEFPVPQLITLIELNLVQQNLEIFLLPLLGQVLHIVDFFIEFEPDFLQFFLLGLNPIGLDLLGLFKMLQMEEQIFLLFKLHHFFAPFYVL